MSQQQRRRVRGRDWHAWAWKDRTLGLFFFAEPYREGRPTDTGKWVQVKFVEVQSRRRPRAGA